jgi:hypothetical protein
MTLTKEEEDAIRIEVLEKFGEANVKEMDTFFMELSDVRTKSKSVLEFLALVKQKYPEDANRLLAALLYGIRLGEVGYDYHLRKIDPQKALPVFGKAS